VAGPALSAVRIGTTGNDTLVGTKKNDRITGKGGNDVLQGRAGNDTYFFADNWGSDSLVEEAGEGIDTVDFHAVATGPVTIGLVPEWLDVDPNFNSGTGPGGDVRFAYEVNGQTVQSVVENAIGGQGDGDNVTGGAGKNVLQPGGGAQDVLSDVAGRDDGVGGANDRPEIPVSNDVYKGFATNTGTDVIVDFGGNGDVLDLRPYSSGDVFATAINLDSSPTTLESLQIVTGLTGQIIILGQFGDVDEVTDLVNLHGHIETIIFANKTFSTTSATQSLGTASTDATSGKQARLAEVAEGLAKEARGLVDTNDPLGLAGARRGE
jgi:Ca2+-binding RTX toxin-like protein